MELSERYASLGKSWRCEWWTVNYYWSKYSRRPRVAEMLTSERLERSQESQTSYSTFPRCCGGKA